MSFLLVCLLAVDSSPAHAQPSCHCFNDRSFDPARPAAADEYILASSFNSLLSARFGIAKQQIVMLRMNGVSGENLIIGLCAAEATGRTLDELLERRSRASSWSDILTPLTRPVPGPAGWILAKPAIGMTDPALAGMVAEKVFKAFHGAEAKKIREMTGAGLSTKEIGLVLAFSRKFSTPPERYLGLRKKGKTWGEIARDLGLAPGDIGPMVESLASQPPR